MYVFRADHWVLDNQLRDSISGEEEPSLQPSLIAFSSSAKSGPLEISPSMLGCLLVLPLVRS